MKNQLTLIHQQSSDAVSMLQQLAAEVSEAEHEGDVTRLSVLLGAVVSMLRGYGLRTREINTHPLVQVVCAQIARVSDVAMMVSCQRSFRWCENVAFSPDAASREFEKMRPRR